MLVYGLALGLLAYKLIWESGDKLNSSLEGFHASGSISVLFSLLRIAGIPPLIGFVAKLIILQELIRFQEYFLALSLLQASVVFIYIYLIFFLRGVT